MPAPDSSPKAKSEKTFAETLRETVIVPSAQLVIAWDSAGNIICEGASRNGAPRVKVEGLTFDMLPAPMQAALIAQRDQIANTKPRLAPKVERPDAEVERYRRNEAIYHERMARWQKWIDELPEEERQVQLAKKERAEEKRRENELLRARGLWTGIATTHGTDLANRAIKDPKRRGRLAAKVNGTAAPKTIKRATKTTFNPALVINIDL